MAHLLAINVPVKRDPAWSDWAKMTRAKHIIYLSSTDVPEQIFKLAKDARTLADGLNADYDKRPFKPHITFGEVLADQMSLEELQTILRSLEQPAFHCVIKEAEHRYRRANGTIKNWKLRG